VGRHDNIYTRRKEVFIGLCGPQYHAQNVTEIVDISEVLLARNFLARM
jgi:hypothetical protein